MKFNCSTYSKAFAFFMIRQLFHAFAYLPLPGNGNFGQQGVAKPNVSSLVSNSLKAFLGHINHKVHHVQLNMELTMRVVTETRGSGETLLCAAPIWSHPPLAGLAGAVVTPLTRGSKSRPYFIEILHWYWYLCSSWFQSAACGFVLVSLTCCSQ